MRKKTIKLSQPIYIEKILIKYYLNKANIINTLMKKVMLGSNLSTEVIQIMKKRYKEIIGLLMFLIVETRFDIVFSITIAVCFTKNLSHANIEIIKIIFYYFKGSID